MKVTHTVTNCSPLCCSLWLTWYFILPNFAHLFAFAFWEVHALLCFAYAYSPPLLGWKCCRGETWGWEQLSACCFWLWWTRPPARDVGQGAGTTTEWKMAKTAVNLQTRQTHVGASSWVTGSCGREHSVAATGCPARTGLVVPKRLLKTEWRVLDFSLWHPFP